jgi:hypothetical protein
MKHIILSFFLITSISMNQVKSQVPSDHASQVLEKLFIRLVNNYNDNDRLRINDSIRLIIDNYVESDTVFSHRFTNLRYLGQITSPDSLLKIVTWNLLLRNTSSQYFCYFIRKQETGNKNKIYKLTTTYKDDPIRKDTIYTQADWYGALYYDLKTYIINNERCWILLGIDYGNFNISRKIIEVLSFNSEDSIVLGKKWFFNGKEKIYRDVFEYASNGMMSLRFRSDSSMVFDHLVSFSPNMKDDKQYFGPDYSNDAYIFKDGLWRLTINIDARNKE